jgi:hypothetical protein
MTDSSRRTIRDGEYPVAAALRGAEITGAWRSGELMRVTEAADHHGVVLPLYRSYVRGELGTADATALAVLARRRRAGALQITASALDVSEWLQDAGVRHVILKGPAVAVAYENADREFHDLDILVAPTQVQKAIATFEEHGGRNIENVLWPRPDGIAELSIVLPQGVPVDLHSDLVVHEKERRDFNFPTEMLLDRAITSLILGRHIPVLDEEDTLIHVAVHAMISGGDRLVWLVDLDALVRRGEISWPTLIQRCREARAALVVGIMLERAALNLRTPVPRSALKSLQKSGVGWAMLLRGFERWRPTAANFGRSFRGQVLVRSTRETSIASLATLARLIQSDVIGHVLSDPGHPWRARVRQKWPRK